MYTIVNGVEYDISGFVDKHPGGLTSILHSAGRDATNLVAAYHADVGSIERVLRRCPHGTVPEVAPSSAGTKDGFYHDLKCAMGTYLRERRSDGKATWAHCALVATFGIATAAAWIAWWCGCWCAPLLVAPIHFLFGINSSHDASHFAFSRTPWVNDCLAYTATPFFWNVHLWYFQHVCSHHAETNVHGKDEDLHHGFGLIRFSPHAEWRWWHRPQLLTVIVAQMLFTTFGLALVYPVLNAVDAHLGTTLLFPSVHNKHHLNARLWRQSLLQWVVSVATLAVPFLRYSTPMAAYFTLTPWCMASVLFILVTQVSHLQQECFGQPHAHAGADQHAAWYRRQVGSDVCRILTGGLNLQSLHHLLPGLHPCHMTGFYPTYARIARTHGFRVKVMPSFTAAFRGFLALIHNNAHWVAAS